VVSTLASYSGHPGYIVCLERFHDLIFHPIVSSQIQPWLSSGRIPVEVRFSTPAQTGRGAHPASCPMYNRSFLGVKRLERDANQPLPSSADIKGRVYLCLYYALGLHGLFEGEFYLFLSSQLTSVKALHKNRLDIEFPRCVSDNKCTHI